VSITCRTLGTATCRNCIKPAARPIDGPEKRPPLTLGHDGRGASLDLSRNQIPLLIKRVLDASHGYGEAGPNRRLRTAYPPRQGVVGQIQQLRESFS